MYLWTQRTCAVQDLARALNQLELDGWEVYQVLPGASPVIVANRPAEREEIEAAIAQPSASPAPYATDTPLSSQAAWWQEAHRLASGTQKIAAVHVVQANTGLNYAEAQRLLNDEILKETIEQEARRYLAMGKKIEAIKRVRGRTDMGLREAKAYVESL